MSEPARYDRDDDLIAAVQRDGRPLFRARAVTDVSVVLGRGSRPELERVRLARDGALPMHRFGARHGASARIRGKTNGSR